MITRETFHKVYDLLVHANEVSDQAWRELLDNDDGEFLLKDPGHKLREEARNILGVDYDLEEFSSKEVSKKDFLESLIDWEIITDNDILEILAEKLL